MLFVLVLLLCAAAADLLEHVQEIDITRAFSAGLVLGIVIS